VRRGDSEDEQREGVVTALLILAVFALLVALALDYDQTYDVFGRRK
jgi:hypothetical protein